MPTPFLSKSSLPVREVSSVSSSSGITVLSDSKGKNLGEYILLSLDKVFVMVFRVFLGE